MGKGFGAERRVAYRAAVETEQRVRAKFPIVHSGNFHEEVVGVLSVNDGLAEGSLPLLKESRIVAPGDGCGFETEHGAQCELVGACGALGHGHEPVHREEFVVAAGTGLLLLGGGCKPVQHEHPVVLRHVHEHRRNAGCGFEVSAGAVVTKDVGDQCIRGSAHVDRHLGVRPGGDREDESKKKTTTLQGNLQRCAWDRDATVETDYCMQTFGMRSARRIRCEESEEAAWVVGDGTKRSFRKCWPVQWGQEGKGRARGETEGLSRIAGGAHGQRRMVCGSTWFAAHWKLSADSSDAGGDCR